MKDRAVNVRLLGPDDAALVLSSPDLFDAAPLPDQTIAMLESERDFLWFAFAQGRPVGFASATMVLHPDQRPVLFLNEIAVDEAVQRRGIGTMLMQAAIDLARSKGWTSTWVLARSDDAPAQTFYRSLSPATTQPSIMFEWESK